MVNKIFPEKENPDMSDRDWETYCCEVWCCNTLNAAEGRARRMGFKYVVLLLERAQAVIWFLLEETGRLKEFKEER